MTDRSARIAAALAGLLLASLPLTSLMGGGPLAAEEAQRPAAEAKARSWPEVKCDRYKRAWGEALSRWGRRGLGGEFLADHDAFLASGCAVRSVCPRSREELELANVMTIAAMNAGTASTFLPFSCRR